ncbi:tRNA (adenosine(37)-N6)-dimethylallyltransferase MiaA [Acetobacteraceae bacterium]|nr:tRNA (adenosine(37)-N6)-dimethylallyltransferase MiaA [Candidatus Parcubacteria bacterium]
MQKPKVIALIGPTASGKSSLGMFLASKIGGEVISADSRQIYRGMHVISRAEKGHMVGVANPARRYSAGEYQKTAEKILVRLLKQKKVPLAVGGTGFYAESLLHNTLPLVPPNLKLRAVLAKKSPKQLLTILTKLDSKSARRVDPHNIVRVIRAIEIATVLGKVPKLTKSSLYEVLWLGLREPKNLRKGVESRLRSGMLAEAKSLRKKLSSKRYSELGFEFTLLAEYLDKKISKKELIERIANGERKYAKRQMRFFKRNPDIHWIKNKAEALRLAKEFLK